MIHSLPRERRGFLLRLIFFFSLCVLISILSEFLLELVFVDVTQYLNDSVSLPDEHASEREKEKTHKKMPKYFRVNNAMTRMSVLSWFQHVSLSLSFSSRSFSSLFFCFFFHFVNFLYSLNWWASVWDDEIKSICGPPKVDAIIELPVTSFWTKCIWME